MKIGWWFFVKLLLVCAILAIMVHNTDLSQIPKLLLQIDLRVLAAAFFLYLLMFIAGAVRYRLVLNSPAGLKTLTAVGIFQSITNQFLPAHAGDISYLALMNKTAGVSLSKGLSSLLIIRFCDIIVIAFFLSASTILLEDNRGIIMAISTASGIFLILLLLVIAVMIKYMNKLAGALKWLSGSLKIGSLSFTEKIVDGFEDAADSISIMKNRRIMVSALFWTLLYWILPLLMSYVTFTRLFNVPITFYQLFYLHTTLTILSVVPIHFFGGLGTMDVSLAAILITFGIMGESESFALSLSLRIVSYTFSGICLLLAFLALRIKKTGNVEVIAEKMYDDEHLKS